VLPRQDALAGPLHEELARVTAGAAVVAPAPALLPVLLRVYAAAVGAHAACAGLHPEVAPLPGQEQAPPDGRAASATGGYFAAAGAAPERGPQAPARGAAGRGPALKRGRSSAFAPAHAPGLAEVLAAARRGSAAAAGGGAGAGGHLLLPAALCAVQRMAVLHERVLRARCACAPRAADAGAEGVAGRSAPCRGGGRASH